MNIRDIEYAALMFFEMCRAHPGICPHDYHWVGSTKDRNTNLVTERYKCGLCGTEITREKKE